MMNVQVQNGKAVRVATNNELKAELGDTWYRDRSWQSRNDWHKLGYDHVVELAQQLTESTGKLYLGVDSGPGVSPRYDIVEAPKVGDLVSYGFNGDCYPCGKIVKISPSHQVTACDDDGREFKFYRRRMTGSWLYNKTWHLVMGHVSTQNPSF